MFRKLAGLRRLAAEVYLRALALSFPYPNLGFAEEPWGGHGSHGIMGSMGFSLFKLNIYPLVMPGILPFMLSFPIEDDDFRYLNLLPEGNTFKTYFIGGHFHPKEVATHG